MLPLADLYGSKCGASKAHDTGPSDAAQGAGAKVRSLSIVGFFQLINLSLIADFASM